MHCIRGDKAKDWCPYEINADLTSRQWDWCKEANCSEGPIRDNDMMPNNTTEKGKIDLAHDCYAHFYVESI